LNTNPEDGQTRPKLLGGLPRVCMLLYLIIVELLEHTVYADVLLHGMWTVSDLAVLVTSDN